MNGYDKDNVVCVHNEVLFQKQNFVITVKTDRSQNHVVLNKPDSEIQMLYLLPNMWKLTMKIK